MPLPAPRTRRRFAPGATAFAAALALFATSACAGPPKPLLWKVSDADNSIYLLGSFHALKGSDYPLAASVEAAFEDAERLAFELSPEEMNSPEMAKKLMAAAMLPEGKTLQSSVGAKEWQRLQAYAARREFPLQAYQRLEPWFISLLISLQEMALVGFDPKQGLDQHFIAKAASHGKPTRGLETADEQIAALDSMTALEQQQSLVESLDQADNFKKEIDRVHGYWRAGDDAALNDMLTVEFKRDYAQLYQRINVERNQAWLPKVRRMLDDAGSDETLVIVGTLHLLGSDGLVSQLRAKGYKVERL